MTIFISPDSASFSFRPKRKAEQVVVFGLLDFFLRAIFQLAGRNHGAGKAQCFHGLGDRLINARVLVPVAEVVNGFGDDSVRSNQRADLLDGGGDFFVDLEFAVEVIDFSVCHLVFGSAFCFLHSAVGE